MIGWNLLREKTDEDTPDTDWVGTPSLPAESICGSFNPLSSHLPLTGVEVVVVGTDDTAARTVVARASSVFDMTLVEVMRRDNSPVQTRLNVAVASEVEVGCALQDVYYFPINGSSLFTIRISNQTIDAAIQRLEIWWRAVTR